MIKIGIGQDWLLFWASLTIKEYERGSNCGVKYVTGALRECPKGLF